MGDDYEFVLRVPEHGPNHKDLVVEFLGGGAWVTSDKSLQFEQFAMPEVVAGITQPAMLRPLDGKAGWSEVCFLAC